MPEKREVPEFRQHLRVKIMFNQVPRNIGSGATVETDELLWDAFVFLRVIPRQRVSAKIF